MGRGSAGEKRKVRILAPNDVMMRRWAEELQSHVRASSGMREASRRPGEPRESRKGGRLKAGSIQVVNHYYAASDSILDCDLLIVDEAHRAKGEDTDSARR